MRGGLAATLLLASLAAGCGRSDGVRALPPGSFVSATASLSPTIQLFGDMLTADVDVIVDRRRLDPNRLRVKTAFAPYEQVSKTEVTRHDASDLSRLRYRIRLRCLERSCLTASLGTIVDPSGGAPRIFRFEPAQLLYADPGAKQPRLLRSVRIPPLEEVSRINAQNSNEVYGFPFRGTVTPLPSLTYGIAPPALAALLLLAALALLVLPATLIIRRVRRRQPPPEEPEPELSSLERAIGLVEWSRDRTDGSERRAALEALAVELDALASAELADETRAAAWSPAVPSPDEAGRLVSIVKELHDGA